MANMVALAKSLQEWLWVEKGSGGVGEFSIVGFKEFTHFLLSSPLSLT